RLLGRGRVDTCADAAALRPALQRRRLRLDGLGLAAMADELVDRGHRTRFVARRTTPQKIRHMKAAPEGTDRGRSEAAFVPDPAPGTRKSGRRKADDCMPGGAGLQGEVLRRWPAARSLSAARAS